MWVAVPIAIIFLLVALYFFNIQWKRRKYTNQIEHKIKFWMLPRSGGFPTIKLMDMELKANLNVVKWVNDESEKPQIYSFDQADTFNDWWPDNEKRKFQVQVPAVIWREGDPTPLTTKRQYLLRDKVGNIVTEKNYYIAQCQMMEIEVDEGYLAQLTDIPVYTVDPPVNATSALAIANEEEVTAGVGDDQLDNMVKQVNDLHKGSQFNLNKPVVYGGLFLLTIMLIAVIALVATPDSVTVSPEIQNTLDAITKGITDIKNGMGLGN